MSAEHRYVLIGHPEHRRTTMFQDELAALGRPPARVVPYADLTRGSDVLAAIGDGPYIVRQDSFGQSFEVERLLLELGYEHARELGATTIDPDAIASLQPDRGRILCPRQVHCGFERILQTIEQVAEQRPGWRLLQAPRGIAALFDKRITSRRWRARGIPVPESLDVEHWSELSGRSYVKLACGSSASCLGLLSRAGSKVSMLTTIEMQGERWYNTRKLRRYDKPRDVERIWVFLRREGMQVERALPKAKHAGASFDLRIVVIAGEPAFVIVRQSRCPITNLHLGGWRGDWQALRLRIPSQSWEAIGASCREIARDVGCFCVGVDVLLAPDLRSHAVVEGNAFGDFFPGYSRDGVSIHGWQLRVLERLPLPSAPLHSASSSPFCRAWPLESDL